MNEADVLNERYKKCKDEYAAAQTVAITAVDDKHFPYFGMADIRLIFFTNYLVPLSSSFSTYKKVDDLADDYTEMKAEIQSTRKQIKDADKWELPSLRRLLKRAESDLKSIGKKALIEMNNYLQKADERKSIADIFKVVRMLFGPEGSPDLIKGLGAQFVKELKAINELYSKYEDPGLEVFRLNNRILNKLEIDSVTLNGVKLGSIEDKVKQSQVISQQVSQLREESARNKSKFIAALPEAVKRLAHQASLILNLQNTLQHAGEKEHVESSVRHRR